MVTVGSFFPLKSAFISSEKPLVQHVVSFLSEFNILNHEVCQNVDMTRIKTPKSGEVYYFVIFGSLWDLWGLQNSLNITTVTYRMKLNLHQLNSMDETPQLGY